MSDLEALEAMYGDMVNEEEEKAGRSDIAALAELNRGSDDEDEVDPNFPGADHFGAMARGFEPLGPPPASPAPKTRRGVNVDSSPAARPPPKALPSKATSDGGRPLRQKQPSAAPPPHAPPPQEPKGPPPPRAPLQSPSPQPEKPVTSSAVAGAGGRRQQVPLEEPAEPELPSMKTNHGGRTGTVSDYASPRSSPPTIVAASSPQSNPPPVGAAVGGDAVVEAAVAAAEARVAAAVAEAARRVAAAEAEAKLVAVEAQAEKRVAAAEAIAAEAKREAAAAVSKANAENARSQNARSRDPNAVPVGPMAFVPDGLAFWRHGQLKEARQAKVEADKRDLSRFMAKLGLGQFFRALVQ